MRQIVKGSSASQTKARDKSSNQPYLSTEAIKQAMRSTVKNIRTPCPLSGWDTGGFPQSHEEVQPNIFS